MAFISLKRSKAKYNYLLLLNSKEIGTMNLIWIIFIGISLLSYIVQANLNRKFKKFSKIPLANGMAGRDVAEKMLHANGTYNAK